MSEIERPDCRLAAATAEIAQLRQQLAEAYKAVLGLDQRLGEEIQRAEHWKGKYAMVCRDRSQAEQALAVAKEQLALRSAEYEAAYDSWKESVAEHIETRKALATERAGAKELRRVLETIRRRGVIGSPHISGCDCAYCLAEQALGIPTPGGKERSMSEERPGWQITPEEARAWGQRQAAELARSKHGRLGHILDKLHAGQPADSDDLWWLVGQIHALTTERDNLASLVEEQRAALEAWSEWCEEETWTGDKLDNATVLTENVLVRSPEQAGARRRAERLVIDLAIGYVNGVVERHKLREAVDVLTEVVRKETGHAGCFQ